MSLDTAIRPLRDYISPRPEPLGQSRDDNILLVQFSLSSVRKGPPHFPLASAGHVPEPRKGAPAVSALLEGGSPTTGEAGGGDGCPGRAQQHLHEGSSRAGPGVFPELFTCVVRSVSQGRPSLQDPRRRLWGAQHLSGAVLVLYTHPHEEWSPQHCGDRLFLSLLCR